MNEMNKISPGKDFSSERIKDNEIKNEQIDELQIQKKLEEIKEIGYDEEKIRFLNILKRVQQKIEEKDKKTIKDVYLIFTEEKFLDGKEFKKTKINCSTKCCYVFLLFIITFLYLIGSFIIVSLKKSFWNLFISVKSIFFVIKKNLRKDPIFSYILMNNY